MNSITFHDIITKVVSPPYDTVYYCEITYILPHGGKSLSNLQSVSFAHAYHIDDNIYLQLRIGFFKEVVMNLSDPHCFETLLEILHKHAASEWY